MFYWSGNSQVVPHAVPGSPKRGRFILCFFNVHSLSRLGRSGVEAASGLLPGLQGVNLGSTAALYVSQLSCCQHLLL